MAGGAGESVEAFAEAALTIAVPLPRALFDVLKAALVVVRQGGIKGARAHVDVLRGPVAPRWARSWRRRARGGEGPWGGCSDRAIVGEGSKKDEKDRSGSGVLQLGAYPSKERTPERERERERERESERHRQRERERACERAGVAERARRHGERARGGSRARANGSVCVRATTTILAHSRWEQSAPTYSATRRVFDEWP